MSTRLPVCVNTRNVGLPSPNRSGDDADTGADADADADTNHFFTRANCAAGVAPGRTTYDRRWNVIAFALAAAASVPARCASPAQPLTARARATQATACRDLTARAGGGTASPVLADWDRRRRSHLRRVSCPACRRNEACSHLPHPGVGGWYVDLGVTLHRHEQAAAPSHDPFAFGDECH